MDKYLRDRIENISDADFFAAIRPLPTLGPVRDAVAAGDRDAAYRLLANYHAPRLAAEAEHRRRAAAAALSDPDADAVSRAAVARTLRHDILGWHTHRRQFGKIIDFNADFGRSGQYGFHYLGWLTPVLDRLLHTADPACRGTYLDIIEQYYDQRTRIVPRIAGLHPVYYELGAAAKTDIILPGYAALCGDAELTTVQREAFLKLLMGFGRSLYRLQRGGYRAGNWQILGAAALFRLGAAFPEWREARKWRKRGEELLREHARRDFFSDGGHGERCWGYGFNSLNAIVAFYEAAERHTRLPPDARRFWRRFLRRAFRWFAKATAPGGWMLNYGDGNICPTDKVISTAHRLFPDWARDKSRLFGVDHGQSCLLKPSGYAFMRAGDDADAPFLSVNFGAWGSGHTHQDLLDFSIWRYGRPLIEEVGRFGSYDNPLDPLFHSAAAHNQIVIEHMPMNRRSCAGEDVRWLSEPNIDIFSARHDAWGAIATRRVIVFAKPDWWFVYDVLTAPEYVFQAASYVHAPQPFQLLPDGAARTAGSPACLVRFAAPDELRRIETGVDYSRDAFIPPDPADGNPRRFAFSEERHRLRAMKWNDVGDRRPITFAALFVPFKTDTPPDTTVAPCRTAGDPSGQAAAFRVEVHGTEALLLFNPAGAPVACEHRTTDAHAAIRLGRHWTELA